MGLNGGTEKVKSGRVGRKMRGYFRARNEPGLVDSIQVLRFEHAVLVLVSVFGGPQLGAGSV